MSTSSDTASTVGAVLFVLAIYIAGPIGWILNTIKMFQSDWSTVDALEIWRIIGFVFAPLGAVLGYF
jgi:hypothetical protein